MIFIFIILKILHFLQQDENKSNVIIRSLRQRLFTLLINLIRYFFWMFVVEFILHYVYINMFLQNIKVCIV